jgi:hypothetical protein
MRPPAGAFSGTSQPPLSPASGSHGTLLPMEGHVFWIASRAAGILALLFSSAAVGAGLMQGRGRGRDLRVVHEALSVATIAAIVFHGGILLADGFLHPGVADITIPFVSSYQRVWMTAGILSGWALILLGLSYYVRGRSASLAGAGSTASPPWPGWSVWRIRSARARTRARSGSWPWSGSPWSRRWYCCLFARSAVAARRRR